MKTKIILISTLALSLNAMSAKKNNTDSSTTAVAGTQFESKKSSTVPTAMYVSSSPFDV